MLPLARGMLYRRSCVSSIFSSRSIFGTVRGITAYSNVPLLSGASSKWSPTGSKDSFLQAFYPGITTSVRGVRSRRNDGENGPKTEENGSKSDDPSGTQNEGSEGGSSNPINGPEKPKLDPATLKKLRMYVLAVAGLSFVTSFLLLAQMYKDGGAGGLPPAVKQEHFNQQGIDFSTFVAKYLRTGEVRSILFVPQSTRAIAILHDGAVIDGKSVTDPVVVVNYSQNAQQFWADIRKEESQLGISLANGVKIDLHQGMTTFRVVELMIGVMILFWLGTQYGRLLRQRMLQRKAQGQSKPK